MKLIGKAIARSASPGAFRIAALNHEIGNYTVKDRTVVKRFPGLRPFGERHEVLHSFGNSIGEQLDFEFAFGGVEGGVDLVGHECDCSNAFMAAPDTALPGQLSLCILPSDFGGLLVRRTH